eukprot:11228968-Alexandrium_andersonii.AAC.1
MKAPHALCAPTMAHAGLRVSPRLMVPMLATTTAHGRSEVAKAEWRLERKDDEESTTRSVGGPSSRAGSPEARRSWRRRRRAASRPAESARRKWPW